MDDEENDLDGLFEEYENNDEENGGNTNNGETNQTQPSENAEKVAAPRRAVRNPRLKFNADRLCGERGIPVVVKHFENVKFKGKGHEVEDLDRLLSTLGHWCHRLYPSMKFEDCLRQIEKLGKKRPVQTCLRKIRMDMPILNDDFVHDEREEDDVQREEEESTQEAFDRLINENHSNFDAPLASTPLPVKTTSAPEQRLGSFGSTLTEEQKKRMEYNKMLATERRKAKFLATQALTTSRDESEDLFIKESSSAAQSSTNNKEPNSVSEDIFSVNTSQLIPETEKLPSASNEDSEELELDDLVDLVDEEDEPLMIRRVNNSSNILPVSEQRNIIDLCNEDVDKDTDKNYPDVVDLEREAERNVKQNKTIDVVNLESEVDNSSKSVAVVDLESETPVNNAPQVVDLGDEEVNDAILEKSANSSNVDFISTPALFSADSCGDDDEVSILDKDKTSGSQNLRETLQEVESMEVD